MPVGMNNDQNSKLQLEFGPFVIWNSNLKIILPIPHIEATMRSAPKSAMMQEQGLPTARQRRRIWV